MNVIFTVLAAVTLGSLVHRLGTAVALYLAGSAFVLAFQSTMLLLEWAGGAEAAFGGPFPAFSASSAWGYGVVNLTITTVGIGLVLLGSARRRRRSAKRAARLAGRDGVVAVG